MKKLIAIMMMLVTVASLSAQEEYRPYERKDVTFQNVKVMNAQGEVSHVKVSAYAGRQLIKEQTFELEPAMPAEMAESIGLVIPELNGKLIGAAQRVPTPTGSTTILHAVVKGEVTVEDINAAMKAAQNESFGYTEEKLVSSDIIGMKFGSLFDANQTLVSKIGDGNSLVQVVAWYDNENSYTSQMVRTIKYLAELK